MAGRTVRAWTSGAWTTASTLVPLSAPPPPVTEAAATATATLGMMAAHVSQQISTVLVISLVFNYFFLVSDDATTKTKLFRLQKKTHKELRVQRRSHNKMVHDIPVCSPEDDCMTDLLQVLEACSADASVLDNDSMMACLGVNISDDCHDCVCEAYAEEGFPCP